LGIVLSVVAAGGLTRLAFLQCSIKDNGINIVEKLTVFPIFSVVLFNGK
jgi:hypothetical protein